MKPNEHVSPEQDAPSVEALLEELPTTLEAILGNEVLHVIYGYGSKLHPDLCYTKMKVGTSWLGRFIRESIQQGIVVPAASDFIFQARDGELEIEFCHDAHVHVSGTNTKLVSSVLARAEYVSAFMAAGRSPSAA